MKLDKASDKARHEAERIIADARQVAEQTFRELSRMREDAAGMGGDHKKQNDARSEVLRQLNEARSALRSSIEPGEKRASARPVQPGDVVEVTAMGGVRATVESVSPDRVLKLRAGILSLTVREDEVVLLENMKPEKVRVSAGAPATLLVGGSGGYAVAAARSFIKKYIAPASGDTVTETAEAVPAAFERAVYPADEAGIVGGTRVALADQQNAACVVVDIADGDNAKPLWTFAPLSSKGFTVSKFGNRIDECRLRYSEVLGKYVICVTSSSGFVGVGEYPSGNRVFDVVLPGYGPHSIEYLPSGAVAVACSGNGNESKAMIRFYVANEKGAVMLKCKSVMLEGAHGIIWDDVRELLWAVGTKDIVAFEVSGELTDATLSAVPVYSATLPKNGGHDIAAFYGDPDRVWIGGGNIVIFNKSTGTFADAPGSVSSGNTKCIGNLDDGRIIRTVATNVYAAHDTDRYLLFDANGQQISETVFTSRAFYKTRLFDPRYTG